MRTILLGVAVALVASPVLADPMMDLAKSKQCLSCHAVSGELLAQSFEAIAKKYHGVANAEVKLAQTIKAGGPVHCGGRTMPGCNARPEVSDAEAKALASWILAMEK